MTSSSGPTFRLEDLHLVPLAGAAVDVVADAATPGRVVMGVHQAMSNPLTGNTVELLLHTNRGDIVSIFTFCRDQPSAVLWLGGRGGSFNGPAGGIFADLGQDLGAIGISTLRMTFRDPDDFNECVLDALACVSFLKAVGAPDVVIGGHGLGGAVAITAAALVPSLKAVVALSTPTHGTEMVDRIAPRPLLLMHGGKDTQAPPSAAEDIYARAGEPKELVLYPNAVFSLIQSREELYAKLGPWLADQFGKGAEYAETMAARAGSAGMVVKLLVGPEGDPPRELVLTREDLITLEADALVCPTGTWLDLKNTPLGRAVLEQGGQHIQQELWALAPLLMGDVGVTGAGGLKAQYIFHAITGGNSLDEPMPTEVMIAETTRTSLEEADRLGVKSIVFPALATGARGFPPEKVAQIMLIHVAQHLSGKSSVQKVVFSMVTEGPYRAFESQFARLP